MWPWKSELPALAALDDQAAAAAINAMTKIEAVETVSGHDVFEATTPTDYNALNAALKPLYHALIAMAAVKVSGVNTRAALTAMFGAGTETRANVIALQTRKVRKYADTAAGEIKTARSQ